MTWNLMHKSGADLEKCWVRTAFYFLDSLRTEGKIPLQQQENMQIAEIKRGKAGEFQIKY